MNFLFIIFVTLIREDSVKRYRIQGFMITGFTIGCNFVIIALAIKGKRIKNEKIFAEKGETFCRYC